MGILKGQQMAEKTLKQLACDQGMRQRAKDEFDQLTSDAQDLDLLERCKKLNDFLSQDFNRLGKRGSQAELQQILSLLGTKSKRPACLDKPSLLAPAASSKITNKSTAAKQHISSVAGRTVLNIDDGATAQLLDLLEPDLSNTTPSTSVASRLSCSSVSSHATAPSSTSEGFQQTCALNAEDDLINLLNDGVQAAVPQIALTPSQPPASNRSGSVEIACLKLKQQQCDGGKGVLAHDQRDADNEYNSARDEQPPNARQAGAQAIRQLQERLKACKTGSPASILQHDSHALLFKASGTDALQRGLECTHPSQVAVNQTAKDAAQPQTQAGVNQEGNPSQQAGENAKQKADEGRVLQRIQQATEQAAKAAAEEASRRVVEEENAKRESKEADRKAEQEAIEAAAAAERLALAAQLKLEAAKQRAAKEAEAKLAAELEAKRKAKELEDQRIAEEQERHMQAVEAARLAAEQAAKMIWAATTIQIAWRGCQTRQCIHNLISATVTFQTAARRLFARQHLAKLQKLSRIKQHCMARRIQRAWRKWQKNRGWDLGKLKLPPGPSSEDCNRIQIDNALLTKPVRIRSTADTRLAPDERSSDSSVQNRATATMPQRLSRVMSVTRERCSMVEAEEQAHKLGLEVRAIMTGSAHRSTAQAIEIGTHRPTPKRQDALTSVK